MAVLEPICGYFIRTKQRKNFLFSLFFVSFLFRCSNLEKNDISWFDCFPRLSLFRVQVEIIFHFVLWGFRWVLYVRLFAAIWAKWLVTNYSTSKWPHPNKENHGIAWFLWCASVFSFSNYFFHFKSNCWVHAFMERETGYIHCGTFFCFVLEIKYGMANKVLKQFYKRSCRKYILCIEL